MEISFTEVYQALCKLDTSKAMGSDNVHPFLLKTNALSIHEQLTTLYNSCLNSSTLPSSWKLHKITPIPKKGDLSDVTNYRPISLLSIPSKVLERIIYDKTIAFIRPKLSAKQFGFLENRSCLTQLLTSYTKVFNSINQKEESDVIYLDFSKAFDKVPHAELLLRLGITGHLWEWFRSYMSDRHHFVSLNGANSSLLPVLSGVPQGSILGPMLFIIYIDDIQVPLQKSTAYIFADDTKIIKSISSEQDMQDLQQDLDNLLKWCCDWKLTLNNSKCVNIHFGQNSTNLTTNYHIGGFPLQRKTNHRDLGVTIQDSLSWSDHYREICGKAYKTLHLVRRTITPHHDICTKRKLYITIVRSNLTYCSQLWRPHLLKDISKIEQVQRRASKFILNVTLMDYKQRLIQLNLLPLMYWYELQDVLFLVKSLKDPPDNFDITNFITFSTLSTRSGSTNKLCYKYTRTSATRHFYFNRLVKLWNVLPQIDLTRSFPAIKHYLLDIFWQKFLISFNSQSVCSYHLVCPCPNCRVSIH